MAEIDISEENLRNLEAIRNVINVEDECETSLDEALYRVLKFYGKFVPYS
jgi:hypothetical protein